MSAEMTLPSSSRLRLMFCASVRVSPAMKRNTSQDPHGLHTLWLKACIANCHAL